MQGSTTSPYEGKLCLIAFKSDVLYHKKSSDRRPTLVNFVEKGIRIKQHLREGLVLDDDSFVPWNNITCLTPLEPLDSPEAGTQAVQLTKDEIWYLWTLASDDFAIDRDEKIDALRASAVKKLLPLVHPEVVRK